MRNLELKVRCRDEAALEGLIARARAGGATYARTMGQRDTYFVAPHGRLKLREWWREDGAGPAGVAPSSTGIGEDGEEGAAGAALIAYARPDDAGSRHSDYILSPVADPPSLSAALARALDPWLVVEKRRVLYRYGRTRIHFDRVARLGVFIELETVLTDHGGAAMTDEAGAVEHRSVIALLGLEELPAVAGSYSDLLAAQSGSRQVG